ncbi:unnamed protein product [Caenorhabditis angaria]|uniref:Carboxylesterase type B domain-containing protein n=1 Tax=Caenorhabditis angaria TaxID=860376 RepID=A0A9P1N571_9PELO|nr:unnamed protein product [Caenorhabditis angaria]
MLPFFSLIILFTDLFANWGNSEIINTGYGSIQGLEVWRNHKLYHSFKKIPFAAPPLGKLRFQKPENPELWTEIRDGTAYGPACMTNSTTSKSIPKWIDEDCLYLNIFVSDYCLRSKNCSTAVYIHGGALNYDSAVMFNDTVLFDSYCSRDVILVIPAFRLGVFSHLVFNDQKVAPYNIAIFDILKAIDFVSQEIQHFGGNSQNIALFGHSYGGVISSQLLFSTEIEKKFQKVVSMSSISFFKPLEELRELTDKFLKISGCKATKDFDALKCLEKLDARELLRIQRKMEEEDSKNIFESIVHSLPLFQPGTLADFHKNPTNMPYLSGVVAHEFDNNGEERELASIIDFKNKNEVYKKYRMDKKLGKLKFNTTDRTQKFFLDVSFRIRQMRKIGAPAYLYEYSNPAHATHTDDLSYIMGVHLFNKSIDEQKLSEVYPEYFMNFIKFGKPAENWEISNGTSYFDIDWSEENGKRPQMRNGFEKEIIDYWFVKMREYDELIEKQKSKSIPKFKRLPILSANSTSISCLSILLIFLAGLILGRLYSTIIKTGLGSIRGLETYQNDKLYHRFKKIPFAAPPVENLRFQKPENPAPWAEIRDGTAYGPACITNTTSSKSVPKWMDEDCLHLNIFVSDFCLKSKNCSTAFYIHGGALYYDSAVMFNDSFLLDSFASRDVILVIPAYRLGIFSHLTLQNQKLAPYNIGIYDMLKALEFVNKEIKNFGGDSKIVTLFGHSYGGLVTSLLSFSTEINKDLSLFQKIVSMSAFSHFQPTETIKNRTYDFARRSGCNTSDLEVYTCLQNKKWPELLRIQQEMEEDYGTLNFEGVLQEMPLFQKGSLGEFHKNPKKIPCLTGATTLEFDTKPDKIDITEIMDFKNPEAIYRKYQSDVEQNLLSFNHSEETVKLFVDTKIRVQELLNVGAPAYLYEYSNPTHPLHTEDLSYIMGVHPFNKTIDEQKLSEIYPEYFINFIKFGKPAENWEISNGTSYFDIDWNEENGKRPKMRNGFEKRGN